MYETQEQLALETIKRVAALETPSVVLWIRTNQLLGLPGAERLMHVIEHLLEPLLAYEYCRLFTFEQQDRLLIGVDLDEHQVMDVMRQIQTFFQIQTGKKEENIRLFRLPQDLMGVLSLIQIAKKQTNQEVDYEAFLKDIPEKNSWFRRVIYQKGSNSLWGYAWTLKNNIDQLPMWLVQKIQKQLLQHPNKDLFGKTSLPLMVQGTLESVWIENNDPVWIILDIAEVLLNKNMYKEALTRPGKQYRLGIGGITSETAFYRFDLLEADFLLLPVEVCLTQSINHVPVFVTEVNTQEKLTQILSSPYTFFQGNFIDLIHAASRKKTCPYGGDCALQTCMQMGAIPHQASQCVCVQHLRGYDAV